MVAHAAANAEAGKNGVVGWAIQQPAGGGVLPALLGEDGHVSVEDFEDILARPSKLTTGAIAARVPLAVCSMAAGAAISGAGGAGGIGGGPPARAPGPGPPVLQSPRGRHRRRTVRLSVTAESPPTPRAVPSSRLRAPAGSLPRGGW